MRMMYGNESTKRRHANTEQASGERRGAVSYIYLEGGQKGVIMNCNCGLYPGGNTAPEPEGLLTTECSDRELITVPEK